MKYFDGKIYRTKPYLLQTFDVGQFQRFELYSLFTKYMKYVYLINK